MKFKNRIYWIPVFCLTLFSCYDDKGNYDYRELDEIEITNIPEEIAVLANAEHIVVKPKVVSKEEGEIKADNPNYSFAYYYSELVTDENGFLKCAVLDSTFSKDLDIPAALSPKQYTCWFEVKDKRTEVISRKTFNLNVASSITNGWMVLCNEGAESENGYDWHDFCRTGGGYS
nr:PKD-like family lipoprotein [Odoribacter splanchnicus]